MAGGAARDGAALAFGTREHVRGQLRPERPAVRDERPEGPDETGRTGRTDGTGGTDVTDCGVRTEHDCCSRYHEACDLSHAAGWVLIFIPGLLQLALMIAASFLAHRATALLIAAQYDHTVLVFFLVQQGADISLLDDCND